MFKSAILTCCWEREEKIALEKNEEEIVGNANFKKQQLWVEVMK